MKPSMARSMKIVMDVLKAMDLLCFNAEKEYREWKREQLKGMLPRRGRMK